MTAEALVREMSATGVLGGGRIGAATDVVEEMFRGPDFTNFLTLAGPMVPSGFRLLIGDLIDRGFLDAIVTSGANLTHDVIEALGLHHYQGTLQVDDRLLIKKGYSRIADIFVKEESFQILDKTVRRLLARIPAEKGRGVSVYDLLRKIGTILPDRH